MWIKEKTVIDHVRESNAIEGIYREPTQEEVNEFGRFIALKTVTVEDLEHFVSIYQPEARLRDKIGLDVFVGNHTPPVGHPRIREILQDLLFGINIHSDINRVAMSRHVYKIHCRYEWIHPFTDCNGRSGRMLWHWMMRKAPLGFLHTWYYQSLTNYDNS